jgi:HSP20 family molecular chaperone IbpA
MSSILRKLTGAVDFEESDPAIEDDIQEDLRSRFVGVADSPESLYTDSSETTIVSQTSFQTDDELVEGALTIDVYQTDNDIVIVSTIAGVTAKDLDVSITNDMVTVSGERKNPVKVRQENYFYQECYWGPFSRSVILPIDVDAEKSLAELKDGVLTVTLPKSEKVKIKKIPVK